MNNHQRVTQDSPWWAVLTPLQEDPLLTAALATAYTALALAFRGPREHFWSRMTCTGLVLGGLALANEPDLRRTRIHFSDIVAGLGSAGILYGIFTTGDRLARAILPHGADDIADIYALSTYRTKLELGARLGLIIGPAEELFWRGHVQKRLIQHYGRVSGTLLTIAAYSGAHLISGNLTLVGAASVAGAFWGGLSSFGIPMGALLVSHASWDILTFLIAPIAPRSTTRANQD